MSSIDEFMEYCTRILDANIGKRSKRIVNKARSMKDLNDRSDIHDYEEFIHLIELNIGVISGKNNAVNICNDIRSKAIELNLNRQAMDIYNSLKTETSELSITEFLRNIYIKDIFAFRTKTMGINDGHKPLGSSMANKIDDFLIKHLLPTENAVNKYATYLAYKSCEDIKKIKNDIIERVKARVKKELTRKAIMIEIENLFKKYPNPTQADINDFVKHIHLLDLKIQEDELRQQILHEMLYNKFNKPRDIGGESSELAQFLDIIKTYDDKKDISKEMQRQGIIYLIEDESGVSEKSLDEFIKLVKTRQQ